MTCPICCAQDCRRSRRRNLKDYSLSVVGVLPWRCRRCEQRFYAMAVPLSHYFYAHCSLCGSLDLQHISGEHVRGVFSLIGRLLHLPALRCDQCRHKFFSIRPLRYAPSPAHSEPAPESQPAERTAHSAAP